MLTTDWGSSTRCTGENPVVFLKDMLFRKFFIVSDGSRCSVLRRFSVCRENATLNIGRSSTCPVAVFNMESTAVTTISSGRSDSSSRPFRHPSATRRPADFPEGLLINTVPWVTYCWAPRRGCECCMPYRKLRIDSAIDSRSSGWHRHDQSS